MDAIGHNQFSTQVLEIARTDVIMTDISQIDGFERGGEVYDEINAHGLVNPRFFGRVFSGS